MQVRRHVAILGNLEPIIRIALLSTCPADVEPLDLAMEVPEVLEEAMVRKARAAIVARSEVSEMESDIDLTVIGVSSSSWDVMVRNGRDQFHLPNPTAEQIWSFIIGVQQD